MGKSGRPQSGFFFDVTGAVRSVIERITGAFRYITTDHGLIHEGRGFSFYLNNVSVANNGTLLASFITGSKYVHLKKWKYWTDKSLARFEIVEVTSMTNGSSAIAIKNRNRNYADNITGVQAFSNPSSITGENVLENSLVGGGGTGGGRVGGSDAIEEELVFKPNSKHLFRFTNLSGTTGALDFWVYWYEEDEGIYR